MSSLEQRIAELARAPQLLVATDFDGTVAPIVADPATAEADRESMVALRMLAALPQTHVAVVSGRALADLAERVREAGDVHLIGSHGSEFEAGHTIPLPEPAQRLLAELTGEVRALAAAFPGALVELKPGSLAFHYRNVAEADQGAAAAAILDGPARRPGVGVRHGKMVVELSVVDAGKGAALDRLRRRLGASAVLFLGDDVTDEDAFATLAGPDVGVKVGDGATRAHFRVDGPVGVASLLAQLAELRAAWTGGGMAIPIEDHSLISDQRTVALLAPSGRIAWLCLPRIDSGAVFAELLGGPVAGYFGIRSAVHPAPLACGYVEDTCILRTEWPGFTVHDYLDTAAGRAFQRAGRTDLVRVIEGRGRVVVSFAPRFDFGRVPTRLFRMPHGLVVEGARDLLVLHAPGVHFDLRDDGPHQSARAVIELGAAPLVLELRFGTGSLEPQPLAEPARRQQNARFWQSWVATLKLPATHAALVKRSALALRALTYGPNGAICAAATTSLPECLGGVRNWDYRFCWPRDAAAAAHALLDLGASGPALKLLDWLQAVLESAGPGALLAPVYSVSGRLLGPEAELAHLAGYAGSRPVRVSNAAAQQVQLDVFGPIADLLAALAARGASLGGEHLALAEAMVAAVERHWREPDHGIWEVRLPRRHYVHSKVMCWLTVDRALAAARYLGRRHDDWEPLRAEIAHDLLAHGWNAATGAFGASYGDPAADAASLWVGLSGLLSPDDARFIGTIDLVNRELRKGAMVRRYRYDDGLPGCEGAFGLCTTWLVEALELAGRHDEATELLDQFARLAGPTGLLAEEFDPATGRGLGNFPQAYSHAGLIRAAVRLGSI